MPLGPIPYDQNVHLKSAMETVFGTAARRALKETSDLKVWQKYFDKTLRSYEVSVSATVHVADEIWRGEVSKFIEAARKSIASCKSFDQALDEFVAATMQLPYLLLGQSIRRPIGSEIKVRLVKEDWKLDALRSVQYVQSGEQREEMIYRQLYAEIGRDKAISLRHQFRRSGSKDSFECWLKDNRETAVSNG